MTRIRTGEARELARLEYGEVARIERGQSDDTLKAIREELAKLRIDLDAKYTWCFDRIHNTNDNAAKLKQRIAALEARK